MKHIEVYSGLNIVGNTRCENPYEIFQFHPLYEVEYANRIIKEFNIRKQENLIFYSNSPDFVSAIFYLAEKNNISCELYLDKKLSSLEDIFDSFNKSYDLLDKLLEQ